MIAKMKKPTVKDVALRAGVSPTTVSLVLNGKGGGIPEATHDKVRRAVRELNYHSDYTARAMVTRKTNLIGVVIPDISNAFFARCVGDLQVALAGHGYDILLCNSEERAENDLHYIRLLAGRNVDGLILTPSAEALSAPYETEVRKTLEEVGLPYLFLDRYYRGNEPKVVVDNTESSYRAGKYLLECGHRRIGAVAGPLTLNSSYNRLKGLKKAMEEYGLSLDDEDIFEGKYDIETGILGGEKLIKRGVTAIFAFSDMQAYGVYESASRAGKKIPDDLSVVGFDDALYSSYLETPLTTMRQPVKELAEEACRAVLSLVEGTEPVKDVRLPAELIVRDSVKKTVTATV